MIPLYNTSHIRNLDSFAIKRLRVPGVVLMENASLGIYNSILEKITGLRTIGIVCGKGNNGGDGFAVARHFSNAGYGVNVISLGSINEMTDDCKVNFEILRELAVRRKNLNIKYFRSLKDLLVLKRADIIIDAILGSGFNGILKEPYSSIVKTLNRFNSFKCAIDVPTGLDSDTGFGEMIFNADLTVTLGENKKGLFINKGYENCGEVVLKEIGIGTDYFRDIDPRVYLIEPEDVFYNLPGRGKSVNKYSAGKVLSIAGSYKYPGASSLTSVSALIAGAGSSVLAVPQSLKKMIHKELLEVVVETYGDEKSKYFNPAALQSLKQKIEWADVVALGPGLDRSSETTEAVRKFIVDKKYKYAVLDADALFALDNDFLKKNNLKNCLLTPHLGEFANILNIDTREIEKDLLSFGREFVKNVKCTLVLKGAPTIIFNPSGEAFVNSAGNSGMAKFGSGDVLTGILAGLLAQNKNIEKTAIAGVYLHSLSADLLLNQKPIANYLASDIMNNYPATIKFLKDSIV